MLNNILKNLKGILTSYQYQRLMKYTGLDLNKSVAIDFTNDKYDRKTQENDLFLFFKEGRLIGILKGGESKKEYGDIISYYAFKEIRQNWKNLKLNSDKILRVQKDQLTYSPKFKHNRKISHKQELMNRLEKYKANKNSNLSIDDLKSMTQESAQMITNLMLSSDEKQQQYMEALKKVLWWTHSNDNITEGFKKVTDHLQELNRLKEKTYDIFGSEYYMEKLQKLKVEIVDLNKILKTLA